MIEPAAESHVTQRSSSSTSNVHDARCSAGPAAPVSLFAILNPNSVAPGTRQEDTNWSLRDGLAVWAKSICSDE